MEFLCEHVVDRKKVGKYKLIKPAIIAGWFIVPLTLMIGGMALGSINTSLIALRGLLLIVPLLFAILAGKFAPACAAFGDIAYEYSVSSGEMTFAKTFGDRFRREWFSLKVSDMERCAPLTEDAKNELKRMRFDHVYEAISGSDAPNIYYAIFRNSKEEHCLMYFEMIKKSLRLIKTYHPATVSSNLPF